MSRREAFGEKSGNERSFEFCCSNLLRGNHRHKYFFGLRNIIDKMCPSDNYFLIKQNTCLFFVLISTMRFHHLLSIFSYFSIFFILIIFINLDSIIFLNMSPIIEYYVKKQQFLRTFKVTDTVHRIFGTTYRSEKWIFTNSNKRLWGIKLLETLHLVDKKQPAKQQMQDRALLELYERISDPVATI